MKKEESKFREKVRAFLLTLDRSWFTSIQQVAIRGTPDFIACINGRFVALELKKKGGGRLAPLQTHNLNEIHKTSGIALVVTPESFEECINLLLRLQDFPFCSIPVSCSMQPFLKTLKK